VCHATGYYGEELTQIMVRQAQDYNFLKNGDQPLRTLNAANRIAGFRCVSLLKLRQ
jgi:hypothetical protein